MHKAHQAVECDGSACISTFQPRHANEPGDGVQLITLICIRFQLVFTIQFTTILQFFICK